MILLALPLLLLVIAAIIAATMAKGDWKRGLKIFAVAFLSLFVLSAGICAWLLRDLKIQ